MTFLTPQEVADMLRCSVWFVYQNRSFLGGVKIGKIVRFEKEELERRLKDVAVPPPGKVEVRFLEERREASSQRVRDKTGSKNRRGRSAKKAQRDERDLYAFVRKQT